MKTSRLVGMLFGTLLAGVLVSCASPDASGPSAGPEFKPLNLKILAKCSVIGYAYAGRWIGPSGGTITAGKHSLVIPAGALSSSRFISIEMNADTLSTVKLRPEGLVFAAGRPARLTLDYKHCVAPAGILAQVAYTTNQMHIIRLLPSADNKSKKQVTTSLQHFSRYAVAW